MSSALLIVASLIVFPFLTYYATSTSFFRRANNRTDGKKPPTAPYFIPGVFNAAGFAQLGARKYFAELIKEYGAFAPFNVRAGPRSYVVLRDPIHVQRVLERNDCLTTRAAKVETFDKLFGSPDAEGHMYRSEATGQQEVDRMTSDASQFYISDASLASVVDIFISILSANMQNKMFQYDTWTGIEDLWSFLQLVLVRCTMDALYGSALLKQNPRMVRDYLDFDAAVEGFVPGMPRVMVSGAATPRGRLLESMKKWVQVNGEATTAESPVWNQQAGLSVVRDHIRQCVKTARPQEQMLKVSAAEMLGITHVTTNEVLTCTFWTTLETLRQSYLTRNMTRTIAQHFSSITHKYDVLGLVEEPFIKSLRTEVRRLRTAKLVARTNQIEGFPLDKYWSLPKGATVAMFSHDIALNTDAWRRAQPRHVERPLEEFWAERFTKPGQKSRYKKSAGAELSGSDAGDFGDLITQLTACDHFPGSRFISAMQTATLTVLFAEFEIQLSDTDELDAILPPTHDFAFGTIKPLEKVAVRIRKRRT